MVMAVPDGFKNVCREFHQDWNLEYQSIEDAVASALDTLSEKDVAVVKSFLDELLSGRYDTDELQRIWWETPADIYFPEEGIFRFLRLMRDLIEKRA
jgi:hypothetical protein